MQGSNSALPLRKRFCAYYNCSDAHFESMALRVFLHRPWSLLVPLLLRVNPALFRTDIEILKDLGSIESGSNLASEVRQLRHDYLRHQDYGLMRRRLNF